MGTFRNHSRWMGASHAAIIGVCAILLEVPLAVHAGPTRAARPFSLSASATLQPRASTQSGGRFSLSATLGAAPSATPIGGGYALSARIVAQPLTCTSDTIFEDGFDG